MIHEFQIIDLAESGQVQLRIVNDDGQIDAAPTEFSVA